MSLVHYRCDSSITGVINWSQGLFCQVLFSDYRYSAAPLEEVLVCSVRCCSLITGTVLHRWKKYWFVLSGVVLWLQVQCCTAGRSTGWFCQVSFSDYRYSAAPLEEVLHRWKKYWLVLSGVVLWLQVQCCTAGRSTGLFSALMAICSTSMVRTFHVRRKELWSGHRWNTSNPISR